MLTLQVRHAKIAASLVHGAFLCEECAFAAILGNGSVVTWGCAEYGGDSSGVQDQLQSVLCISLCIQRSVRAFAAIRADGFVVTWGGAACGVDSSAVWDQLHDVQHMHASFFASAAVRADGFVVTSTMQWVATALLVPDQLHNVQHIQASSGAFAAIRADGSVVTCGHAASGCESTAV